MGCLPARIPIGHSLLRFFCEHWRCLRNTITMWSNGSLDITICKQSEINASPALLQRQSWLDRLGSGPSERTLSARAWASWAIVSRRLTLRYFPGLDWTGYFTARSSRSLK